MTDSQNIHRVTYDDREILLIGTAHVSKESAELVDRVIREEKPDTVCVELCQSRYQALREKKRWQEMDLIRVIREKKAFLLLSNLMLAHFQKKIGEKLGIRPGEEILRAIQAAEETGAQIQLVDRDIRITLARTWRLMGLWTKAKLLAELITSVGELEGIKEEEIERMKNQDVLEALLSEVGESLPVVRKTLIDERDQYISFRVGAAPGKKIVAVLGAGHIPGVLRSLGKPVDMGALELMPPKGRAARVLQWAIPLLIVGVIFFGFLTAGIGAGTNMLKWWGLTTGILAGLGAAAAFAHPLTILSAVLAAPFTTLHPLIAAGWVSGLVEAFITRPKVKDFESLPEDISSLRGFWRNRITRVLMVVVFTNLGASIGTFVAIPLLVRGLA